MAGVTSFRKDTFLISMRVNQVIYVCGSSRGCGRTFLFRCEVSVCVIFNSFGVVKCHREMNSLIPQWEKQNTICLPDPHCCFLSVTGAG